MTRIDHLVITHYHGDHHGGVEILAENVPIGRVYDHGTSIEAGRPNVDAFMERYTEITSRFGRTIVRPGDRIPFAGVDVLVVTSHGDINLHRHEHPERLHEERTRHGSRRLSRETGKVMETKAFAERSSAFRFSRLAAWALCVIFVIGPVTLSAQSSQSQAADHGEWRYWGGDAGSTRYSALDQIDGQNFKDLEIAWVWRGDNFGPSPTGRANISPLYVNGVLYTHAGTSRQVVAIDPATGETLWNFREPHTPRWEDSTRKDWGKGVAYAEVDGRGVIYMTSPAYFLHALDAVTGRPLEGFGKPVPIDGFGEYGVVDMLAYNDRAHPYDPYYGSDRSVGYITTSSPPIVVNGVIVVGSALQDGGTPQTRIEQIPGDILAFDARTGEFLWKFHTVPREGEYGVETWGNDSWSIVGNTAAWAPLSADPERGLVFVSTENATNDYFGGFRPGDNLFANSVVALDIQTGERVWHYQISHHDIWDWDLPWPAILTDLTVDGEEIPAAIQLTKQAFVFAFNRETGEPIWPIEDRPVPRSQIPGERSSPTQPHPTRPAGFEMQGITEDDLIDFTPALRARALEIASRFQMGPLFNPPLHRGNEEGLNGALICPAVTGGFNITGGASLDPESGILYVSSIKTCTVLNLVPGADRDDGTTDRFLGETVVDWVRGPAGGLFNVEGLPILKPPYGRITAIDMNTGEHLWWIPNGDTPPQVANHPLLKGMDIPNTGRPSYAHPLVTGSLLIYGEGTGGEPRLHAVDKATGEPLATVNLPGSTRSTPISFMHEGRQYIVASVAGPGLPASFVALRLRR